MPIEVMDMVEMAKEGKRKVIFNTKKFHARVHVYPEPGDKDDMHCHNADQTFYVIDGECTMHFPDGGKAVMKPGMVATITSGSFYQLENTGAGPAVPLNNCHRVRNPKLVIIKLPPIKVAFDGTSPTANATHIGFKTGSIRTISEAS